MGNQHIGTDDVLNGMRLLVVAWSDRGCLRAFAALLPAYTSFDGTAESWKVVAAAAEAVSQTTDPLLPDEWEAVAALREAARNSLSSEGKRDRASP